MSDRFDKHHAATILTLLDAATEGWWPQLMREMRDDYGYTAEEMHGAWQALANLAGLDDCPDLDDFKR